MKGTMRDILRAGIGFALLAFGTLYVPLAVYLDVVVLGHGMPEIGVTEISQEILIFLSATLFVVAAIRERAQRGFLFLVAGAFYWAFVRELDFVFDQVSPGFWKIPATGVVVAAFLLALRWRETILPAMAGAIRSVPFAFIQAGLAILLFFSRVFGTGVFWEVIMEVGENRTPSPLLKNSVQEGTELLGYILIFYGSVLFHATRGAPASTICSRRTEGV